MIKKVTPTGSLDQENDYPFIKDGDYRDAKDVSAISDSGGNTISWEPKTQNNYAFDLGSATQQAAQWSIDFTNVTTTSGSPITINVYRPGGILVNGYTLYIDNTYANIPSTLASILVSSIAGTKTTTAGSPTNTSGGLSDVTYTITAANGGNSFRVGQKINTSGFGGTGYNLTKAVVTSVSATSFTVRVTTPTGSGGTGVCRGSEDPSVVASVDLSNSNKVLYSFQTSYPWDFYITCADSRVKLTKLSDPVDAAMAGSFSMCGGQDLLGDLFVMSTTSKNQKTEITISSAYDTGGGAGVLITTNGDHGLQLNETVYVYGVSVDGVTIQPEWIVGSIPSSNSFTLYGADFDLFAAGNNNYVVDGTTYSISSYAKVARYPKTLSRISVAQEDVNNGSYSCIHLLTTSSLNFRLHNRIHLYCEDEGFRKSFYWCDGVNKDRVMYYSGSYTSNGFLDVNGGSYSLYGISSSTTISIRQQNILFDMLSVQNSGGVLKSGNYRYAIRFLNEFFSASEWSDLSNIVNIYSASFSTPRSITGDQDGTATTKSVLFSVSNIPSLYKYYEIAYVRYSNNSYEANAFRGNITSSSFNITHTGEENSVDFNIDDLNTQNSFYDISKSICALDNRLIRSNLTSAEVYDFSSFFKTWNHEIKRKTITSASKSISVNFDGEILSEYREPLNVRNQKTFMPNETYRFSARVKLKDGYIINDNFWIDDIVIDGNSITNSGNVFSDNRRNSSGSLSANTLPFTDSSRNPYVYYINFLNINWEFGINGIPVKEIIDCVYIDFVEISEEYKEVLTTGLMVMPSSKSETLEAGTENVYITYGKNSAGNTDWGPFTGYYTDAYWNGRTSRRYSSGLVNSKFSENTTTNANGWVRTNVTYTPPAGSIPAYFTTTASSNSTISQNMTAVGATSATYITQGLDCWVVVKIDGQSFTISSAAISGSNIIFTLSVTHDLTVGTTIVVSGLGGTNWNGTYTITAVGATTVTVAQASAPTGTPGTGTLVAGSFPYTGNPLKIETATGSFTDLSFAGSGVFGSTGYYTAPINTLNIQFVKLWVYNTVTSKIRISSIHLISRSLSSSPASNGYDEFVLYDTVWEKANKKAAFFLSPDIYHSQQSISYAQGDSIYAMPILPAKSFAKNDIGSRGAPGGVLFQSVYDEYNYSTHSSAGTFLISISGAKELLPFEREKISSFTLSNNTELKVNGKSTTYSSNPRQYYTMPKCMAIESSSDMFNGMVFDSGLAFSYYIRNKGKGAKYGPVTNSTYVYSGFNKSDFTTNSFEIYGDCFVQNTFVKLRTPEIGTYTYSDGGYAKWGWGYGIGTYSYNRGNYQMEYKNPSAPGKITDSGVTWLESNVILFGIYTNGYSNRFEIKSTRAYDPSVQVGNRFPTRICYSNVKQNGSFSDDYRTFQLINFRDLNLSDGEITHHDVRNGELYTWQPRSVQKQYFNSRSLLQADDGTDVVVGDAAALRSRGSQITSIGTSHKWSIAKGVSRGGDDLFVWINTETGDIVRLGYDGTVPIAQVNSMMSSIKDKLKWAANKYSPAYDLGVNCVWDDSNKCFHIVSRGVRETDGIWSSTKTYTSSGTKNVYVYKYTASYTNPKVYKLADNTTSTNQDPATNPNVWTEVFDYSFFNIDYSMLKSGFQSYHSWIPKIMLRWKDTFVSSRPWLEENKVYIHNRTGNVENCYPGTYTITTTPYITPVCVLDYNMKTEYEAIELNSSGLPSRIDFTTGQHVSYLLSADFEQDEVHDDLWAAPIKNDSTVTTENPQGRPDIDTSNLYGQFLLVKYLFNNKFKSKLFNFIIKLTPMSRLNNS